MVKGLQSLFIPIQNTEGETFTVPTVGILRIESQSMVKGLQSLFISIQTTEGETFTVPTVGNFEDREPKHDQGPPEPLHIDSGLRVCIPSKTRNRHLEDREPEHGQGPPEPLHPDPDY